MIATRLLTFVGKSKNPASDPLPLPLYPFASSSPPLHKISSETVRADFNDMTAVLHYTRAAHELGLWESERLLIERFFTDENASLLEAGCGAGRVTMGLWKLGFHRLTAFDFAEELVDQARSLAAERGADKVTFLHADATHLAPLAARFTAGFAGALFMFNGLMQIPGRRNRRLALKGLHRLCVPGAPLLFTTHDRDISASEQELWRRETEKWVKGEQNPRLVEFGDRYFEDDTGRTFMHLPNRAEILEDLALTGWVHAFDDLLCAIAKERRAVLEFSDECRFGVSRRGENSAD